MRLALGSAAAPEASLDGLLEAAVRRGLAGVELEQGHGHGVGPVAGSDQAVGSDEAAVADAAAAAAVAAGRAGDAGVPIVGFRLHRAHPGGHDAHAAGLARFSELLGAPILVPCGTDGSGLALLEGLMRQGSSPVAVLPARSPRAVLQRLPQRVAVGWDADPGSEDLAGTAAWLLEAAGARLRHIRLHGGGPESTEQEGRGVGSLLARLAVNGYDGTLVLVPSAPRYRIIWDAWLGRRGGWGCGSVAQDRTLVSLGGSP